MATLEIDFADNHFLTPYRFNYERSWWWACAGLDDGVWVLG